MQPPERFKSGETLKTDIGPKLNRLVDFVRALQVFGDGNTIKVNRLPGGTYLSARPATGGGGGAGFGIVTLDGLTAADGQVTATVTTLGGIELASQTVNVDGCPADATFNAAASALCWRTTDGEWATIVTAWDYSEGWTGYDVDAVQVPSHDASGNWQWVTVTEFECPT